VKYKWDTTEESFRYLIQTSNNIFAAERRIGLMNQLAYGTLGDPTSRAVMLLHGFMPSDAHWLLNLDTLSGDYHLIMVELWGLGESPEPESLNRYSIMFHESCKGDVT